MKTNDIILQTATKVVLFLIVLFSVHIFFAGHYTPGGGFVGGLLTSGAIVLLLLAFDMKTVSKILPVNYIHMIAVGLLFAIGTGAGALLFNVPFLTHAFGHIDLPVLGDTSLHTATLFDLGVFLVVVGVTMTIIQTIGEDE
ncbi:MULTISPECIES: Na(+)/H(+) antiporter subunit B [Bacillaceae]|jgi:multicomponent Na+:H+ antiporter subunit B|uniref:Na(+)/H(+) antiporter subunit B n=1 Tax=Cytobacillus firmus TaxID=1399 RepID=A0A0J5YG14_CYTFI|nr:MULTISPECIES: Na(+)/H(+) antiporter subunit B [Bacillaceae]KML36273.1 monovalent cation/H+ antiporter subunit B [Cytobacillus firmus]MBG9446941.1 monovalent cation/H+ antiporter subunit B [Cytobacillus firmus]MBG9452444.1 monovalent cation/H+ antiporter subunit B [Cytobacillus firmus]MBG9545227.1 monovalent cation/H+ antiporter subunit B [Cytobacillus firmus]MBG9545893.1 monovalent cation/H+ antiporter subunit B [Cytobacillus firmus]